jgi:membrane protein required for beta-lactamase induction
VLALEGEALLGHWLPRALADVAAALVGLGGQKTERADWLRAWGLPHEAAVDEADEAARRGGGLDKLAGWIEAQAEAEAAAEG